MRSFYRELQEALESGRSDIWIETVLEGENAGEKRMVRKDAPEEGTVFRERLCRTPQLVICGGGHVAAAVVRMGKLLEFEVTVLEDRPKFADNARAAGADLVICEPFGKGLSMIQDHSDCWFVIVTRGHRYDSECLETILGKKYAYVGMMGSRRRVAIVKDQLEKKGISRAVLDQVHTPIGLKIGAETPEEIAVSILAEIISVRNSEGAEAGFRQELLEAIAEQPEMKKVLATIISRKGSAPRGVGTKMLVCEDGNTVGTIGGGCIESEVLQKALLMMRCGAPGFQICSVDMTAAAAEEEGMVCGGVVEVMLETV